MISPMSLQTADQHPACSLLSWRLLRGHSLQEEGVIRVEPLAPSSFEEQLKQTLICFVLVDSAGKHHFCSRYDFGPWPLLPGVNSLPEGVSRVSFLHQKILQSLLT